MLAISKCATSYVLIGFTDIHVALLCVIDSVESPRNRIVMRTHNTVRKPTTGIDPLTRGNTSLRRRTTFLYLLDRIRANMWRSYALVCMRKSKRKKMYTCLQIHAHFQKHVYSEIEDNLATIWLYLSEIIYGDTHTAQIIAAMLRQH